MIMELNKHFQMCEINYLPLLPVKTFVSRSPSLNKFRWMKKKGIAVHEAKNLINRADLQCREIVI